MAAGRCTVDSDCPADTPVPNGNGSTLATCICAFSSLFSSKVGELALVI